MKKTIKSIVKVSFIFMGLFIILIAAIFIDQKVAEFRADSFCEAAGSKQTLPEIKQLLTQTNGTDNIVFADDAVIVQFPQVFPEYYVCVISLNSNQTPIKYVVSHKD